MLKTYKHFGQANVTYLKIKLHSKNTMCIKMHHSFCSLQD